MLVVLESTTYPGTTEEVVQPILERRGLKAGEDFFLAFSPERVDPGNEKWNTKNVPKVVGGLTTDCSALAKALYSASIDTVIEVGSPKVAEMVKLLENTFRAVNIGLVNELALMCDRLGMSVWEVVEAAATKPFGFMPFYPGPGLGGHCIPIDPFYLSWKVKEVGFEARFIELAGHVNGAMPHHVVEKIVDALNSQSKSVRGSSVLLLGDLLQAGHRRPPRIARAGRDGGAASERRAGQLSRSVPAVAAGARLARRVRPAIDSADAGDTRRRRLRRHRDRSPRAGLRRHRHARATGRRHPERDQEAAPARLQARGADEAGNAGEG